MDRVEQWLDKKVSNISKALREEIKTLIKKGAYYICEEPSCNNNFRAKPNQIIEKCQKCGSHRITLTKKIDSKLIRVIALFPQEDWP